MISFVAVSMSGAAAPDYDAEFKAVVAEVGGAQVNGILPACQCPPGATSCCVANCLLNCCTTGNCPLGTAPSCKCDAFGAACACVPYNTVCVHPSPHSHTYGSGGSAGGQSDTAFGPGSGEFGAGVVTVTDDNTADCNLDGIPGDFDGDYETGVGGGFFGYQTWADEPVCRYGLDTHSGTPVVSDVVFGSAIHFVIGADDTGGPRVDPVTGECSTDGSITPGDPETDPTADPDDCLTQTYVGTGTTCGAGGDGGYWVFLSGFFVDEGPGVSVSNPPTEGTITA